MTRCILPSVGLVSCVQKVYVSLGMEYHLCYQRVGINIISAVPRLNAQVGTGTGIWGYGYSMRQSERAGTAHHRAETK